MTMRKFLLVPALFLLGLFLFSAKASAQGTYGCEWAQRGCGVDDSGCETGYRGEASYCGQFNRNRNDCDNATRQTCIANTCDSWEGTCKARCDYPTERGIDRQDCPAGEYCCILTGRTGPGITPAENDPTCTTSSGEDGIDTAIGCIPIEDTNAFIGFILRWAIGIGGGIAFLLIIYAAFMTMTSQGNPERLKAGQELLTSAIAGLIMLIFSIFILNLIGVNILGIFK